MVSFENFVKSLPPSLSELKVKPIFCFPIKIRDDPTASNMHRVIYVFVNYIGSRKSIYLSCGNIPLLRQQKGWVGVAKC
jgi:hypothetical protein